MKQEYGGLRRRGEAVHVDVCTFLHLPLALPSLLPQPQASTATPRNPNSPPPTGTHAQAAADKEKAALAEKEKAALLEKEREKAAAACPLVASSRLLESIAPVADKHRGSITAVRTTSPPHIVKTGEGEGTVP